LRFAQSGNRLVERRLQAPSESLDGPRDANAIRKEIEHVDAACRQQFEESNPHLKAFGVKEGDRPVRRERPRTSTSAI
jgi:hypothetical protein